MNYTALLSFQNEHLSSQKLFDLLQSEDFDFQGKEIEVEIKKDEYLVTVHVSCKTLHFLKIATNAVINSFTVIEKTVEVMK